MRPFGLVQLENRAETRLLEKLSAMSTFEELVASRKQWIEEVLQPWCRLASARDLRIAGMQWKDLAGDVDAETTLWSWAWSRFPELVHDDLSGVNEAFDVEVTLSDGRVVVGFPDARESKEGELVLISSSRGESTGFRESGPHLIDDILSVTRR